MLKKRIIFSLLYDHGNFMLSRNFRLQKVGDLGWLHKNYNFSQTSYALDELVILDVSRGEKDNLLFSNHIKEISKGCFLPIAAGGGVNSVDQANNLLRSGADKIILNSVVASDRDTIIQIASLFGSQCVIISVDVKQIDDELFVFTDNGSMQQSYNLGEWLEIIGNLPVGELYLNSIDRDGTGQGFFMKMLDYIPANFQIPIIIAGGAGNYNHLAEGLSDERVNAVATAHLFNFIGDGLESARNKLILNGFDLVKWDKNKVMELRNYYAETDL